MLPNNTLFLTIIFLILPLIKGLTLPLIPPTSPRSPFYNEILKANNISTTTKNIKLDQTHYLNWLLTKKSVSINEAGEIYYNKGASYHVMSMYVGNPLQLVNGIFDTGSDIVWFECVDRARKTKFTFFNQTQSSTYKSYKCGDSTVCKDGDPHIYCTSDIAPCEFMIQYKDGTSVDGIISTDGIKFNTDGQIFENFKFGCSVDNTDNVMGAIGASNNDYSLPRQLHPDNPKFSYCISDDLEKTSLVKFGPEANLVGDSANMMKNNYYPYYYIEVRAIKVNQEDIDVNKSEYEMSFDGRKGFTIDSGAAFTYLTSVVFDALQKKIEQFLGPPTTYESFTVCYPSSTSKPVIGFLLTDFVFEFPADRVWAKMSGSDLECLQMYKISSTISVLGAYQLVNVNIGHDPNNALLYLQRTTCPTTN